MTINDNLFTARHGNSPLDNKIGNVRARIKCGHPKKRYFTISTEEVKQYYLNLIEARWLIKQNPDSFREVTDMDLDEEQASRGTRTNGKSAVVIEETDDKLVVRFRGELFTVIKQVQEPVQEALSVQDAANDPAQEPEAA